MIYKNRYVIIILIKYIKFTKELNSIRNMKGKMYEKSFKERLF